VLRQVREAGATRLLPSVIVHDDLGPPHILVDESGGLSGVIDWEDVSVGDPAGDFAWMLGERPEIGRRMLSAFGGAGPFDLIFIDADELLQWTKAGFFDKRVCPNEP
jgi:aminoglycoside phosphotransferase (APT) family kinase protein